MEKNRQTIEAGRAQLITISGNLGMERFQAQSKWEIPVKPSIN